MSMGQMVNGRQHGLLLGWILVVTEVPYVASVDLQACASFDLRGHSLGKYDCR